MILNALRSWPQTLSTSSSNLLNFRIAKEDLFHPICVSMHAKCLQILSNVVEKIVTNYDGHKNKLEKEVGHNIKF